MKRVHLDVSGRVQGVSFRAAAWDQAKSLGLVGYAKNLPGGRLEIVVEGEEAPVEAFIAWCWRGPKLAQVQDVAITDEDVIAGEYTHFAIRY